MASSDEHFDRWFAGCYRRVLGSVLIVCGGDLARAEDATNEAFLDALERWPKVAAMSSPVAWVTKVAINKAKRAWLRRSRHVELINSATLADSVSEIGIDPELWEAVARLTPKQRTAIAMRYVEDRSQADIASELGVAPGTVSATLTQARKKLRTELEGETL